jgi:Flp pilus assembly pilin Flp
MMMLSKRVLQFLSNEDGLETVEWAVVGTAVVIVAIAAFQTLGTNTNTAMNTIAASIPAGGGGS